MQSAYHLPCPTPHCFHSFVRFCLRFESLEWGCFFLHVLSQSRSQIRKRADGLSRAGFTLQNRFCGQREPTNNETFSIFFSPRCFRFSDGLLRTMDRLQGPVAGALLLWHARHGLPAVQWVQRDASTIKLKKTWKTCVEIACREATVLTVRPLLLVLIDVDNTKRLSDEHLNVWTRHFYSIA